MIRRLSVFRSALVACVLCASVGALVASLISAFGDASDNTAEKARFAARLADSAKISVLLADSESRTLAIEAAASAGVSIFLADDGETFGEPASKSIVSAVEAALFPMSERHEIRTLREGPNKSLFFGQELSHGFWIWAKIGIPDPDYAEAAWRTAIAAGISILLATALSFAFASMANRWSGEISSAAKNAANGQSVERGSMPSELFGAMDTLSGVSAAVRKSEWERETALAGIAHDARTPLSRILLAAELTGSLEAEKTISDSVKEITSMLEEFAGYARAGSPGRPSSPFDPAACAAMAVESIPRDERQGVDLFTLPLTEPAPLASGDPELFRRGIANIVLNSLKHGKTPVSVIVRTLPHPTRVEITVTDSGNKVSDIEMERLKAPFARGDLSRSTKGSGLGLAIAERAAQSAGGTLSFFPKDGGGFVAIVLVPCPIQGSCAA